VTAGVFRLVATVDIGLNIGELVGISATSHKREGSSALKDGSLSAKVVLVVRYPYACRRDGRGFVHGRFF
jgi:hypothetical protein